MRIFVIGDIHGAGLALASLIEKSPYQEGDRIIFLGDLVNGWPDDKMVLDLVSNIPNRIVVLGNHDIAAMPFILHGELHVDAVGSVMENYGLDGKNVAREHKEVLTNSCLVHEELIIGPRNYRRHVAFVHSGLPTEKHLGETEFHWETMHFTLDKTMLDDAKRGIAHPGFDEVFVGHSPAGPVPKQFANVTMMDTGAGWKTASGNLTMMDVETRQFWSERIKKHYAPRG